MKSAVSAGLLALVLAFGQIPAHAQTTPTQPAAVTPPALAEVRREVVTTDNSDYFGFDLRAEKDVTLEECTQMCIDDGQCRAFTFNTKVNWCFLKSDFKEIGSFEGAIAGKIVETALEPDIGAPPALDFVPAGTLDQARAFERRARNPRTADAIATAEELVEAGKEAFGSNNANDAVRNFTRALSLEPDNFDNWLAFARLAAAYVRDQNRYDYRMQEAASSAAVGAYNLSRTATKRAEALAALALALEQRSLYRPALEAYKRSLELDPSVEVSAAYHELRNSKGFRVTGSPVEADNTAPRICIEFSEDLVKSGVDYSNFVQATADSGRAPGAIEASGKRICIDGLEHGGTYRITLRAGLPSAVGEVLEEPVVINSYVRDRAPSVRFTGDSFVLPQNARQGIPLVGINTDSANLELYRVGERSLAGLMSGSHFLSQIEGYSLSDISDDLGQVIWKGTVDLEREANREVVTSVPLAEILKDRAPGVYVMTAKAAGVSQDSWEPMATQWFLVSDIGLTTYAGTDGLTVFARSLDTAKPLANVELTLLARNNEVLGKATSDADGKAVFQPGLMRGTAGLTPSVLTAGTTDKDFSFLDLTRAGFDLSDRGVEGRTPPGPLDVFVYLDRGIYRPGETVHSVSMVRDDSANAGGNVPLTVIFRRPDEKEAERIVSAEPSLGAHAVSVALPDNAMQGVWRISVHADPNAEPIAEKQFLVEDFIPDRTEFDLSTQAKSIAPGSPATIELTGRFLYGAPAADQALEGEMRLRTVRERAEAPGYQFGLADEEDEGATIQPLSDLGRTDDEGKASFDVAVGTPPATTRPLAADIVVRMREDGGRAVERILTLPVLPQGPMIGIRPEFGEGSVAENSTARFRVIALDSTGARAELKGLAWTLYRIDRNYQWFRDGSYWQYEAVEIPTEVAAGTVDATANGEAQIQSVVGWGRYRLDVESAAADGPATSVEFDAGWYVEASTTETPDALEIALDRESYGAGQTAKLKVSPRFAGELLVAVGAEKLYRTFNVSVPAEGAEIDIPVGEDWGAGAYVTATVFRPGSAEATRLPARAIGTVWLKVDPGKRELDVSLGLPEKIRPNGVLTVPVTVAGLTAGEEAYVTVAAIDVGILNLTRFTPPDPGAWYFGQRALGLEIRDLYGRLIDGSLGNFGRVRVGGDGPGLTAQGSPPTEKLLALFSGIVKVDEAGKASIDFEVPQFNGTARVMAVAWSQTGVGNASGDVVIRDPVVLSASLPKVLAPGDEAQTIVEIHNTDGPAGAYTLGVESEGTVAVSGLPDAIELAAGERKVLALSLSTDAPGTSELVFTASHDGEEMTRVARVMTVRPATAPVSTRMEFPLAATDGSVRLDAGLLGDVYPQGAEVSISVTRHKAFDVSALLTRLDRYPFGCAEQTTSRALPLLYLSDLDAPAELIATPDLAKRVDGAIERVLNFQSPSGSFGLWGPGYGDLWLDSYITDFLTRAREKGYTVPELGMRLAVQNLQNTLGYENDIKESGDSIAYALYVLARNRMASVGDLRYYADTRIGEFPTALSRAHIAAALSLYNEIERANRVFAASLEMAKSEAARNLSRSDYGSPLRDGAAILALASETRPMTPLVPDMLNLVAAEIGSRKYTSTQEDAWLLLAARSAQEQNKTILLEVDGQPRQGALNQTLAGDALAAAPMNVVNRTGDPLTAVVTTFGSPRQPLPAGGQGFTIERTYYTLDGEEAQLNDVRQNDRFVVVLTVTADNDWSASTLVQDLLPGGFEIDNPRLVKSADLDAFAWLGDIEVAHTEFRNDRFVAAFERGGEDDREYSVAYVVRAVTPGRYMHPAASVEDMYRPELAARTATGFLEVQPAE